MPGVESRRVRQRGVCAACLIALLQVRCSTRAERPTQAPTAIVSPSAARPSSPPASPSHDAPVTADLAAVPARVPELPLPATEPIYAAKEAYEREHQKRRAIALVHRLPEVKAYCHEATGCALVESEPSKGCIPDDAHRRECAWGIAIAHVEPSGPHLSYFARFYVRNNGQLFVEPIQTGELVGLREWRCLARHGYETSACTPSDP